MASMKLIVIPVIGVIVLIGALYFLTYRASERTVVITVQDKGSVVVSSGSGEDRRSDNQYRVYTDKGVFIVADSFVYFNWRSADRYGALRLEHTYKCKAAGWRVGLLSWFPNLISCEPWSPGQS